MLLHLLPVMEFVSVVPPFLRSWPTARDENDLPIWTAAVRGQATFVISHNVRDFPPRNGSGICAYDGIEYITTENFVRQVLAPGSEGLATFTVPPGGHIPHLRQR
jgi:hypothetical protein